MVDFSHNTLEHSVYPSIIFTYDEFFVWFCGFVVEILTFSLIAHTKPIITSAVDDMCL